MGLRRLWLFTDAHFAVDIVLIRNRLATAAVFASVLPAELYDETRIDELYFLATNGGVTFGGGEPGMHPDFIREFRELCGQGWQINLETSL